MINQRLPRLARLVDVKRHLALGHRAQSARGNLNAIHQHHPRLHGLVFHTFGHGKARARDRCAERQCHKKSFHQYSPVGCLYYATERQTDQDTLM